MVLGTKKKMMAITPWRRGWGDDRGIAHVYDSLGLATVRREDRDAQSFC
jgi:hypothetical protein